MHIKPFLAIGVFLSFAGWGCDSFLPDSGDQSNLPDSLVGKKRRKIKGLLSTSKTKKAHDGSPILSSAKKNPEFDAQKWLESDRTFFKRNKLGIGTGVSDYDHIIKKMARRYGFDWRLIAAQIYVESNFRSSAKSHAGAQGLMQIMPRTAEFMGTNPAQLHLPEINIAVGCMYNQRMYSLWGKQLDHPDQRLAFALASYNAGRGRVLRSYRTVEDTTKVWDTVHPDLPKETQMYVHKIYLKYDFYSRYVLP